MVIEAQQGQQSLLRASCKLAMPFPCCVARTVMWTVAEESRIEHLALHVLVIVASDRKQDIVMSIEGIAQQQKQGSSFSLEDPR